MKNRPEILLVIIAFFGLSIPVFPQSSITNPTQGYEHYNYSNIFTDGFAPNHDEIMIRLKLNFVVGAQHKASVTGENADWEYDFVDVPEGGWTVSDGWSVKIFKDPFTDVFENQLKSQGYHIIEMP